MTVARVGWLILPVVLVVAPVRPDDRIAEPADDTDPNELTRVVERLASPIFKDRIEASRQLSLASPAIRTRLETLLERCEDPETRHRLASIITTLKRNELILPTKVSLSLKKVGARTAFQELSRQSGYKIRSSGLPDNQPVHDFHFVDVPYWYAVDQISSAAGATTNPEDDQGTLGVHYSDTYNPYVSYSGPFRIVATNITANQYLQLAGLPRRGLPVQNPEYIGLNFQIHAEPKAPMVGIGPVIAQHACDEFGTSLIPGQGPYSPRQSHYSPAPSYRSFNMSASVALTRSYRQATRIKEFRGKIPVLILTATQPVITIDNLLSAKQHNASSQRLEITLSNVQALDGGGVQMTASIRNRASNPNDYSWSNTLNQRIVVLDEKGEKLNLNTMDFEQNSPESCVFKVQFSPNKNPAPPARKFIVYEWETLLHDLTVQFRDIPLP
jgi:hypothetical protein